MMHRKKTDIDQYLNFSSHHPINVINTLLHRRNNVVPQFEDREKEVELMTKPLQKFGYRNLTILNTKEQQSEMENTKERSARTTERSKSIVTLLPCHRSDRTGTPHSKLS